MNCPKCKGRGYAQGSKRRKSVGDVRRVYMCGKCGHRWADAPDLQRGCAIATRVVLFSDSVTVRRRKAKHENNI